MFHIQWSFYFNYLSIYGASCYKQMLRVITSMSVVEKRSPIKTRSPYLDCILENVCETD